MLDIPEIVKKIRTKCRLEPYKRPSHAALRKYIFERDGFTCQICGKSFSAPECYDGFKPVGDLELDHIIPRSKGVLGCVENMQTLCCSCNAKKADNLPVQPQKLAVYGK